LTRSRFYDVERGLKKKGEKNMAVKKAGEKYRCNICGNEVVVTKVGGGTLVCCGKNMEKIEG
jgi:desulfoferrodoxin-like iron-binding protein